MKSNKTKPLVESHLLNHDVKFSLKGVKTFNDNRAISHSAIQLQEMANKAASKKTLQLKPNSTGLPDHLKTNTEQLSGHSLDDVKVHYNSSAPAQLNAHAFAQGNQIHVAPGQEKHLPHETWHVVQQKQGRVKPTKQLKAKVAINDSQHLETEADKMGNIANRLTLQRKEETQTLLATGTNLITQAPIQRKADHAKKFIKDNFDIEEDDELEDEIHSDSEEQIKEKKDGNQSLIEEETSSDEDSVSKKSSKSFQSDKPKWKGKMTFETIFAYIHNPSYPLNLRLELRKQWNRGMKNKTWLIDIPQDAIKTGGESITSKKGLKRSDSMELDNMDYQNELSIQSAKKHIIVTTQDNKPKKVPIFESTTDVTRLTRLYGKSHKKFGEKILGSQFALKLGKHVGLFDAPQGNDLVYVPLKQKEKSKDKFETEKESKPETKSKEVTHSSNDDTTVDEKIEYLRDGKIFNWSDHADELKRNIKNPEEFKNELMKALEGELIPNSEQVVSTLGALICDAKLSIVGYLSYLNGLKKSKEVDPKKLFSSKPEDNPVWEPSVVEGRIKPDLRRKEKMESYKEQIRAYEILYQNNCLINAIARAAGRGNATEMELIEIRIAIGSVGDMLLATPENVTIIRRGLRINNTVIVRYVDQPAEVINGGDPALTIYHDGGDHFSHEKPEGKNYDFKIKEEVIENKEEVTEN